MLFINQNDYKFFFFRYWFLLLYSFVDMIHCNLPCNGIMISNILCIAYSADVATLANRNAVEQCQEKVNSTLLEYCSTYYASVRDKFGQLLVRLPEIRLISLRAEDYLYFRHLSGDIPESTLLMEMLHSKRK